MSWQNKIYIIDIIQKKAIRLLTGLPRLTYTSEAYGVLNILPFSAICKFNILKFLNHYKHGLLPNTFKSDFIFVDHMKRTKDLRSRNTFFLKKIRKLPPYKFPNAWNENKHLFSEDNSTSTFLTNLINDHYEKKIVVLKRLNVLYVFWDN